MSTLPPDIRTEVPIDELFAADEPRPQTDPVEEAVTRPPSRSIYVAAVVVAVGLIISIVLGVLVSSAEDANRDEAFDLVADQAASSAIARLDAYGATLSGIRGLFGAIDPVSRQDFAQFVRAGEVLDQSPGTSAVGWAPATSADDVGELEQFVRADGIAGFTVTPAPVGGQDAIPIVYLEPPDGERLGFNLAADEENDASIDQAMESGQPVAGPPYAAPMDDDAEARAANLYLALYTDGRMQDSPQGRAQAFEGVTFAVLRVDDVLDTLFGETPRVELEIYDLGSEARRAGPPTPNTLLYDSNGEMSAVDGGDGGRVAEVDYGGRRWLIQMMPGPGFDPPSSPVSPLIVTAIGIVVTLLIASLVIAAGWAQRSAAQQTAALTGDMSEYLRDRESELERANEEAVRSNLELERYASIAAHDLQEPLRSLLAYASVFERRHGESLDEEALGYLHRMRRAAERARTLVVDLLAYAKLDSAERLSEDVDLNEAVRIAIDDLALVINENGATIRVGELPTVPGNRRELIGVFSNLLSNAIKYRSEEPPQIVIVAHRHGDLWNIGVRDNGLGVDPAFHDRIFELFRRLEKRDADQGTGLGLAICARTVQTHGGQIWVESEEGAGSTFRFTLPAERPEADSGTPS